MAAATAAAAAGAAAAFPLTVFSLDASLLLEFVMEGGLAFALETECCLNSFVKTVDTKVKASFLIVMLLSIPRY